MMQDVVNYIFLNIISLFVYLSAFAFSALMLLVGQ